MLNPLSPPPPSSSSFEPFRAASLLDPQKYADLAQETGLSRSHVRRVLKGQVRPSLDVAARLADATGLTIEDVRTHLQAVQEQRPPGEYESIKLTRKEIEQIDIRNSGSKEGKKESLRDLAKEYGVSHQTLSVALRNYRAGKEVE